VNIGPFQILVIALLVLLLFGRGRISEMMGDFGKGVKSFRKGLNEEDEAAARIDGVSPAHRAAEAKPADSFPSSR